MKRDIAGAALLGLSVLLFGCGDEAVVSPDPAGPDQAVLRGQNQSAARTLVSRADVEGFLPAGDQGGGVLVSGTFFPPTTHGHSTLQRGTDWIQMEVNTSGLPPGAYTAWWVVFNEPSNCSPPGCGADDLLSAAPGTSIFWSTGGVVRDNGTASFRDRHHVDDDLGIPGEQHILGPGLLKPQTAEVHFIIKYHGPASDDPEVLHVQTHTLLGSCAENANAIDFGSPFGVQCFDPQAVVHRP